MTLDISWTTDPDASIVFPPNPGWLVASDASLLDEHMLADFVAGAPGKRPVLLVGGAASADAAWERLSRRAQRALKEADARIASLQIDESACEIPDFRFRPTVGAHGLSAAALSLLSSSDETADSQRLLILPDEIPDAVRDAVIQAIEIGYCSVDSLSASDLELQSESEQELQAPRTFNTAEPDRGRPSDAERFWSSIGSAISSGQRDHVLADPYLASGAVPAHTSTGNRRASVQNAGPRILHERCTGCGDCWSMCPDAAIVATAQGPETLIESLVDRAEADGVQVFGLKRLLPHITKKARRLFDGDDLQRYTRLDVLTRDAWARVADRAGLDDAKRNELDSTVEAVLPYGGALPIIRTEWFADSGRALSILIDTDACTSCGLCAASCPDDAIEMTESLESVASETLDFLQSLPEIDQDEMGTLIDEAESDTEVVRLLNRSVRDGMLSGIPGAPGDTTRTALRMTSAAVESVMVPRLDALEARLQRLRDAVQERIRSLLSGAMELNDLDALARRLNSLEHEPSPASSSTFIPQKELIGLIGEENLPDGVDAAHLSTCARALRECTELLETFSAEQQGHLGGAVLVFGTDPASSARAAFPYNPYPFPWVHADAASCLEIADGILDGMQQRTSETAARIRFIEAVAERTLDASEYNGQNAPLSWDELTPGEKSLCPPVLTIVDSLSGGALRRLDGDRAHTIVLLDAEPSNSAVEALLLERPLVVQTGVGSPGAVLRGVREAIDFDGPALVAVHVSDPDRHGVAASDTAEQARLAVASRAVPSFTFDPRRGAEIGERLDLTDNVCTDANWSAQTATFLTSTGRLASAEWPLTPADWALREGRYRHEFTFVPRGSWPDTMMPVASWLELGSEERPNYTPFVQIADPDGRAARWVPSDRILSMTERGLHRWNVLRELAGLRSSLADRVRADMRHESEERQAALRADVEKDAERRLADLERTQEQRFQAKLKNELLKLSGFGPESDGRKALKTALREFASSTENGGDA